IATHPYSVGYDFNHESPYTRQFFKDVYKYWITEFKVDGFRLDLSKGLTQTNSGDDVSAWSQYDQSRINILTDYYNYIKSIDQDTYVILEHLANNDEEKALANTGMLLWSAMH
ncbi:1,4-alpha-glucan-branching protein, partial [bacterium]|nr:1,4-alpha-glucan-branching protein [bacterium]